MADDIAAPEPKKLSSEEWFQQYAARGGNTVEFLREQGLDVFPCACDYEGCEGWACEFVHIRAFSEALRDRLRNKTCGDKGE